LSEPKFSELWELTELFKNAEILKKGAEAPFSFLMKFATQWRKLAKACIPRGLAGETKTGNNLTAPKGQGEEICWNGLETIFVQP
jgi:hypothetical protein